MPSFLCCLSGSYICVFAACMVYYKCMKNKKFVICYNNQIQNSVAVKDLLAEILLEYSISADIVDIDNLKNGYEFAFIIGGDGTILKAARFFAKTETAIFGVNLGRLGFLSQSSKEHIRESVEKILNNHFHIEERIMLECDNAIALNDFVVKGNSHGRTAKLSLKINGKAVCDYLADGLIISTPTGSTAYGLSAGGPVLAPNLGAFVIVPICPHTLTARPLVIPDNEVITVSMGDSEDGFVVSTDGQNFFNYKSDIIIKKSSYKAKLALLDDSDFYSILRDKLHWGTSPANI